MSNDHDISVLNGLIETTLDSMKGFKDAAEDAQSGHYASLFGEFAKERSQCATLLQQEVRGLGGTPQEHSSFIAAAHRSFMDLRQALAGKNDKAIINEVERGEDHIKAKFEDALADDKLGASTKMVIEQAFQSVRAGHARMSALKHNV